MSSTFTYTRRVAYCDTDAMKVVHHSNYLRYFEEARVAWLRARELHQFHDPHYDLAMAVVEARVQHLKPAYFDDLLTIRMQVCSERLKIRFRYAISSDRFGHEPICLGETLHVPINGEFKICRLPQPLKEALEREKWTETWP